MYEDGVAMLQTLKTHKSDITCCDFFGNALLATGSGDKTVRVWEWKTGLGYVESGRSPLKEHRYGVTCVQFSPQGTMLATTSIDGSSLLWNTREWNKLHKFVQTNGDIIRSVRFSPDSCSLVTAGDNGAICVWDLLHRNLIRTFKHHEGSIYSLSFTPDSLLLLTTCTLSVLKIFQVADVLDTTVQSVVALTSLDNAHDLGVLTSDFSSIIQDDETDCYLKEYTLATGGQDHKVRLWTLRSKYSKKSQPGDSPAIELAVSTTLEGHSSAVTCVKFTPKGGAFASASVDKTVRLWDFTGHCLHVLDGHTRYVNCVVFCRDGTLLCSGSNDKEVKIWDLTGGQINVDSEIVKPCSPFSHFGSGDLEGITLQEEDKVAIQVEVPEGEVQLLQTVDDVHLGPINSVDIAVGNYVATACGDKTVHVFRWSEMEEQLEELEGSPLLTHRYQVNCVAFDHSASMLMSCSLDGSTILYRIPWCDRICALSVIGTGAARASRWVPPALSSEGARKLVLVAGDDAVSPLWDVAEYNAGPLVTYSGHSDAVTCCAFTPDGRFAVTASQNGDFRLYVIPPPQVNRRNISANAGNYIFIQDDAHDLGVQSADFHLTPERVPGFPTHEDYYSNLLATCGNDDLAKLWNIQLPKSGELSRYTIKCVQWRQLVGHGGNVLCVRFSPDNVDIACTTSIDKQARIWCIWSGGCLHVIEHTSGVACCAIGAAGFLITGCLDGTLNCYRIKTQFSDASLDVNSVRPNTKRLHDWSTNDLVQWLRESVGAAASTNRHPDAPHQDTFADLLANRVLELGLDGKYLVEHEVDDTLQAVGVDLSNPSAEAINLASELRWARETFSAPSWRDGPPRSAVPHHFLCPITHDVMADPVRCSDGFTYERSAILEWFLSGGKYISPMTNQPLYNNLIIPNRELKRQMREFFFGHQD